MNKNKEIGRKGESVAADYLKNNDYRIIERNFRKYRKEIDLIALHEKLLVFIEVKTRFSNAYGPPEDSVDDRKIEHILECANHYIEDSGWEGKIRFDIITVRSSDWSMLTHIKDAFY